ncbi:MAG TPA: Yip1 family protein [Gallionella sp.]|nr:Yip1 family protein [Gallionella sp.]
MNLVERAKNIVLQPKSEWLVIEGETATVADLYREYIMPLAAIGPVASIIGMSMVGINMPMMAAVRVPLSNAITSAIISYVLSLIGVFVIGLIIDALAPNFGGRQNRLQSFKVATYASTASWLGGIFLILPVLGIFSFFAMLYGIYLLYLGLPVLMKAPQEKAGAYTAIVVVVAFVVMVAFGAVSSMFMPMPVAPMR